MLTDESDDRELHPLENHLILEHVFKHCSPKDLRVCRQVCQAWRDISLKFWRSTAVVTMHDEDDDTTSQLSEFLEFVEDPGNRYFQLPYTNFSLHLNNQQFWTLCGEHIKYLELSRIQFQSVNDFRNVLYQKCPNLQYLTLQRLQILNNSSSHVIEPVEWEEPRFQVHRNLKSLTVYVSQSKPLGVSWMELFSHFPTIETFKLTGYVRNCNKVFKSFNTVLRHHQDPKNLKLKNIDVLTIRYALHGLLLLLSNPNLNLESLSVYLDAVRQEGTNFLRQIFTAHASSLKKLVLKGACCGILLEPNACFVPHDNNEIHLENLEELVLETQAFESLYFIKFIPNLKRLVLKEFLPEMVTNIEGIEVKTCTELKIYWRPDLEIKQDHLKALINLLPNLERLEISNLNNELFSLVCEYWTNLLYLQIYFVDQSQLDDSGLTGFDLEDVIKINKNGEAEFWLPVTVPRANLTNLKDLRSFSIECFRAPRADSLKLGYCAAVHGIQKMLHLRHLRVADFMSDDEIWTFLHSQFPWL